MNQWKVILATMVIFICGAVTGALLIESQNRHPARGPGNYGFSQGNQFPNIGPPSSIEVFNVLHHMKQAGIDLSTNQSNNIVRIIENVQATNAAIRKSYAPLLQTNMEIAYHSISLLLTPEQRPVFDKMRKDQAQGREGRPGEMGGRRGEPPFGRRGGDPAAWMRNTNRGSSNNPFWQSRGRFDGPPPTNLQSPGLPSNPPVPLTAPSTNAPTP